MEIQQGFNRIGISVAIAFLGLAVVCLLVAGSNYIEYRQEIAAEYKKYFGDAGEDDNALALLDGPEHRSKGWERLKDLRFRSVDQSLNLAVMCVVSGLLALIFWFAVGRAYVAASAYHRRRLAGTRMADAD
jgi:hypothetical protein